MPTMTTATELSFHDLEQTATVLANGFEVLLSEVEYLVRREQHLKDKLDFAHDAYRELALDPTLIASDSAKRSNVLRSIKDYAETPLHLEGTTADLGQIADSCKLRTAFQTCREWKGRRRQRNSDHQRRTSANRRATDEEQFERDFTTQDGLPSSLECPFAKSGIGDGSPSQFVADPIAAELHHEGSVGAGTAYVLHNPNKCPIRYLDQHSPKEVAQYFENHKHEIPRSHTVCVSRYQQNDAKIRQLDAKYGNLQDMIQRLGEQHQQYLPAKNRNDVDGEHRGHTNSTAVENWADKASGKIGFGEAVTPPPSIGNPPGERGESAGAEGRCPRPTQSEKPLREIRVGESPSRPWGISVPIAQQAAASAEMSEKGIEPLSQDAPGPNRVLPLHDRTQRHGQGAEKSPLPCQRDKGVPYVTGTQTRRPGQNIRDEAASSSPTNSHPHMIFNGPVFFGYSAEQAMVMLQPGVSTGPAPG